METAELTEHHKRLAKFRARIRELEDKHDLSHGQAYMLANAEANSDRLAPFRLPGTHRDEFPFAQGLDGLWHVRKDDFWDNDLKSDVRAHALCGDIWSCHVSSVPPGLLHASASEKRHCRVCFPVGRKSRHRS